MTLPELINAIKFASSPGENTAFRIGSTFELMNLEKITAEYPYSKAETDTLIASIPAPTVANIKTVNDLRLTNLTEGAAVSLLGYYSAGDKRPLTYVYTLLNFETLVDDGGAVIKTSTGSWIAQFGGTIDARDYGCSDTLADNSTIFNNMVLKNPNKKISVEGLNLKFTSSLVFNTKMKIQGVVRGTIFDFTGLAASEYAFRLATSAAINGFELDGIRIVGVPTVNCFRFNQTNNSGFSVTDSFFSNLRIEGFNVGLQSNYVWCNIFQNVRFNGCIEPLILNSQSNQLKFDRCSFVSFKKALKHTNCEGVTFDTCNIANFNLAGDPDATQSFMSLFQSNVTIINPYFEYVTSAVLAVGGSSEVNKSSLNILGGKTTDDFVRVRVNGNDTKISLKGLNNKDGKDIYALENGSNIVAPTNYVRELYLDNGQTSVNNTLFRFDGNQEWNFTNYGGGAISTRTVNKGYKTIQMNGPVNTGVRLTNALVAGKNYIFIYMINKRAVTGSLRIHHGADYQVLPIQELTDNFEMRYIPFVAMGTNLDLACTVTGDSFDFRFLMVVEGNYIPNSFEKTYIPHFPSIPTGTGNFNNGDIVKDSVIGDTYYSLVSGIWKTVRLVGRNESGQVKVNYTGLQTTGFTANTVVQLNIGAATGTVAASPTTKYPNSTPNSYAGFFDSARNGGSTSFAGRLIENPIAGQAHRWRIQGSYSGKSVVLANTQMLYIRLRNPVSGFEVIWDTAIPPNQNSGNFTLDFMTIADNASIPSPNGYIIDAIYTTTDAGLNISFSSITRFSDAIEP